jgi:hypothetical protein
MSTVKRHLFAWAVAVAAGGFVWRATVLITGDVVPWIVSSAISAVALVIIARK